MAAVTAATSAERGRPALQQLCGAAGASAYLAGAGGSGMRGLATFLLQCGWRVWGADRKALEPADPLRAAGLRWLGDSERLPPVSLAVRSLAVSPDERGYVAALAGGARALAYPDLLGEITRLRPTLAVAGSHGKTTSTAWIAYGLRQAGVPVGFLVGGHVPQLGGSADWGDAEQPLVVESCEYQRSFHKLAPWRIALTNVDAEHPDTYPGGLPEVTAAFAEFVAALPAPGRVYAGPEAPDLSAATAAAWRRAAALPADWPIGLPGAHNRRNAALVAGVLRDFGCGEELVRAVLRDFRGAARRLEEIGRFQGAAVVSDYAHHPAEVAATLQAARERYGASRLVVAFQPHQARRFAAYREQFAAALREAGALLLLEIYRARDPEDLRPSVAELVAPLRAAGGGPAELHLAASFADGAAWMGRVVQPRDVILCLGAGDVDAFARQLAG